MYNPEDFLVFNKESVGQQNLNDPSTFRSQEAYYTLCQTCRGDKTINGEVCPDCKGKGQIPVNTPLNAGLSLEEESMNSAAGILDYQHQTWTGYVRSNSEKDPDTFAEFVKDICRG